MAKIPRTLSKNQWSRLKQVLPPQKPQTGRPNKSHFIIIHSFLWLMRTGAPWRDLPERYGAWKTVYSRFYRWSQKGIFQKMFEVLLFFAEQEKSTDWSFHCIDSTSIRTHQHAAGARRLAPDGTERNEETLLLGRSRGGFSTKVHMKTDVYGRPLSFVFSQGQRHDSLFFELLMTERPILNSVGRRHRYRPKAVIADRGYSAKRIRNWCFQKNIRIEIPMRRNEKHRRSSSERYKKRNVIERAFCFFKHQRKLATRYEKIAETWKSFWYFAACFFWL